MNRKDLIMKQAYFQDKETVVDQILSFEEQGIQFLSNQFQYKENGSVLIGDHKVKVGRIDSFYFIQVASQEQASYQVFLNDRDIKQFFGELIQTAIQLKHQQSENAEQAQAEIDANEALSLPFWFNQVDDLELLNA